MIIISLKGVIVSSVGALGKKISLNGKLSHYRRETVDWMCAHTYTMNATSFKRASVLQGSIIQKTSIKSLVCDSYNTQ